MPVTIARNIKLTDLEIQKELNKPIQSGLRTAFVNYPKGTTDNLIMQTPSMRMPFDITMNEATDRHTIDVECSDSLFLSKLKALDEHIKAFVQDNSQAFLKKESVSDEMLEHNYSPIVKSTPNTAYLPKFRYKVNAETKIYDTKKNILQLKDITRNCNLTAIVELKYIWTKQGEFGVTFLAKQIRVDRKPQQYADIDFIDTDDDE